MGYPAHHRQKWSQRTISELWTRGVRLCASKVGNRSLTLLPAEDRGTRSLPGVWACGRVYNPAAFGAAAASGRARVPRAARHASPNRPGNGIPMCRGPGRPPACSRSGGGPWDTVPTMCGPAALFITQRRFGAAAAPGRARVPRAGRHASANGLGNGLSMCRGLGRPLACSRFGGGPWDTAPTGGAGRPPAPIHLTGRSTSCTSCRCRRGRRRCGRRGGRRARVGPWRGLRWLR